MRRLIVYIAGKSCAIEISKGLRLKIDRTELFISCTLR